MWKMRHGILVVFFSLAAQVSSQEQSCQINNDLLWTGSARGDDNTERIGRRIQVIITEDSFMFDCHGNVTEWKVDLFPRASYRIALQVWRESSGCYSSVGANTLTTFAGGIVTLNLKETPASQIQVQPSDLIGFSVIQAPTNTEAGIIIDRSVDFSPATYIITSDTRVDEATLCLRTSVISSSPPVISVSVERSTSPIYTSTPAMTSSPSPMQATTTLISPSSLIPTPIPIFFSSSSSFSSSSGVIQTSQTLEPTPTPSSSSPTEATTDGPQIPTHPESPTEPTAVVPETSESTEFEDLTTMSHPEVSRVSLIVGIVLALLLFMVILGGAITIMAVFILSIRKRNHHAYSTGMLSINNPIDQSLNGIEMKKNIVYGTSSTQPEMDIIRNEAYGVTSTGGESLQTGLEVSYDYVNEGMGPNNSGMQEYEPEYDYIDD